MVIVVYLDLFVVVVKCEVIEDWIFDYFVDIGVVKFVVGVVFDVVVELFYYYLLVIIDVKYWYVVIKYCCGYMWVVVLSDVGWFIREDYCLWIVVFEEFVIDFVERMNFVIDIVFLKLVGDELCYLVVKVDN